MQSTSLKESFDTVRETLAQTFMEHRRVGIYLKRHTALIDRMVKAVAQASQIPSSCALVAVGGYGRCEMFPYSDIDLLILLPDQPDEAVDRSIETFVGEVWNFGLTVGHSVRPRAEMIEEAKKDITISTAFLEARLIHGNEALFKTTYEQFLTNIDPRQFFVSKMLEMRQRHQRYADTPYALEPNIKESPGGLRDLQVFLWCAKVAGYGNGWRELARSGLITEQESYHLAECQHFLDNLRVRLHLLRRRHEDRLIFDVQTALAENAGFKRVADLRPSEALMKRYYINAKNTVQLNAILMQAIADRLFEDEELKNPCVAIDHVFYSQGNRLDIMDEDAFVREPSAVLRTFYIYAKHRELKRLSTRLLRALWHARYRVNKAFREDPVNKGFFLDIVKLHYGPYHSLKNMNTWGILGRFLPVFRRIVGQMQHDLFHAYTVDQHTLRVVKFLRRFAHSAYAHEFPLCSQVMNELPENWRLTLVGLFHDIAKGRGGDHSELGAREMHQFAKDFGLEPDVEAFCSFLIANHLLMSNVAQKQDIGDPNVIKQFADVVKTKERLDGLFLLTVADIRATGPKIWNAWKQQLLENLYRTTLAVLQGQSTQSTQHTVFEERKQLALSLIAREGIDPRVQKKLWKQFDVVYFMRHSPEDIAWHTKELAEHPQDAGPLVRCRPIANNGCYQILVYVPDQKDLFARVVAYFDQKGLSVLDARVHTTKENWALDTFFVEDKNDREDQMVLIEQIESQLKQRIEERKPLGPLKTGRLSRRSRIFPTPTMVDIEHSEAKKGWVLQITCNDRLGLLSAIATVLARNEVNLETAKIATLDERAEDIFLINGKILETQEGTIELEKELLAAIENAK